MVDVQTAPSGPPPGPGVQPPFVAAPIEGRRTRMWLGVGLAGGVLAACCGIGVAAVGGLLVLGERVINEQAQRAVTDYLTALSEQDWEQAYEQRCAQERRTESLPEFTRRVSSQPAIDSYRVGDLRINPGRDDLDASDDELSVPVDVTYADGTTQRLTVPLEQNRNGELEVCGQVAAG